MAFHVGQKVVCVDDDFVSKNRHSRIPSNLPKKDEIYTIRSFACARGKEFVRLCEVINSPGAQINCEPAFDCSRFRPIVERKTDISIFTAMLTPKKQEIDA